MKGHSVHQVAKSDPVCSSSGDCGKDLPWTKYDDKEKELDDKKIE